MALRIPLAITPLEILEDGFYGMLSLFILIHMLIFSYSYIHIH